MRKAADARENCRDIGRNINEFDPTRGRIRPKSDSLGSDNEKECRIFNPNQKEIKQQKRNRGSCWSIVAATGIVVLLFASGCSTTVESQPEAAKTMESGGPLPPSATSFLGLDSFLTVVAIDLTNPSI